MLMKLLAVFASSVLAMGVWGQECQQRELTCRLQNKISEKWCSRPNRVYDNEFIPDCCDGENADFCESCHENGCDECCDYTMKADFCTPCIECWEYDKFATQCTDFVGSQKCLPGCRLVTVNRSDTIFAGYCPCDDGKTLQKCECDENPCPCLASLNVAFIVDGSCSIAPEDFQLELEAVENAIGILEGDSQAMIIQFASTKRVEVPLQQAEDIGNVDFPKLGGGTRWVKALKKAIATLEAAKSDNNASLIVLVTDGKNANDAPDCAPCPQGVCGDGIPLVVMTVGVDELKPCYLNAAQDNKVPVSDFGALEEKLKQQLEEACKKL